MREFMNQLGRDQIPFLFILDYELIHPVIIPLNLVDPNEIQYNIRGRTNAVSFSSEICKEFYFRKKPVPKERYSAAFDKVVQMQKTGYSYLVNLTFPSEIETNLTLKEIFDNSPAPYKLFMKDHFVVFSPESFVRIENNLIKSFPMKGTIDASIDDAERRILENPKESAEHATIVDLIRNDLSMVATEVKVSRYRYTESIKTHEKKIIQVSSEITGKLSRDYPLRIGDIISNLLPAGSISGAPKKKTMEIIAEAEGEPRGYYTGIFGVFDGMNLDSGVMIRFIEKRKEKLFFRSGGGITAESNKESEYQELIDKIYVPIR